MGDEEGAGDDPRRGDFPMSLVRRISLGRAILSPYTYHRGGRLRFAVAVTENAVTRYLYGAAAESVCRSLRRLVNGT